MTKEQFYGWSREDAAPLNEPATPRPETWLTRQLKKKQAEEAMEYENQD